MEVSSAVIPPRVAFTFRMLQTIRIDKPNLAEASKRLPLTLRHMRSAMAGTRIPDIEVGRRHIEVPTHHNRQIPFDRVRKPTHETIEPRELGLIERRIDDTSIRCVYTNDMHATTFGRNHA